MNILIQFNLIMSVMKSPFLIIFLKWKTLSMCTSYNAHQQLIDILEKELSGKAWKSGDEM